MKERKRETEIKIQRERERQKYIERDMERERQKTHREIWKERDKIQISRVREKQKTNK